MKSVTVVALLFSTSAFAQQATVKHNVNLRQAAHLRAHIIETIPEGQNVELMGPPRGSFYRVKSSDGQEGWAWQKNISVGKPNAGMEATMAFMEPRADTSDRAHGLVSNATGAQAMSCGGTVSGWDECHKQFDTGCTSAAHPNYDAYLNYLKNELPDPASVASASVRTIDSLDGFLEFDQQSQDMQLGKQPQVQFGDKLADVGEGNIFTVVGYIYYAQMGGNETCNCQESAEVDRDVHIGIGFDSALAAKIADGSVAKGDPDLTQKSIIAEMTPHYRGTYHPSWSPETVQALAGHQVKLIGQLLVDNEHNLPAQNCALPNAGAKCWRASVWEIHPVFTMYVCNSSSSCSGDTNDGWQEFN
jgi:hypothetical protein